MTHSADESDEFDQPETLPRQPPTFASDEPNYFAPPPVQPFQSYAPPPPLSPQPSAGPDAEQDESSQPSSNGPRHYSPAPFEPPQPMQSYQPPQGYEQRPEPQPAPIPRPEDLLVPNQSPVTAEPASWGWRGRVNRATGGLIKPKAGPDEVAARRAIHEIQRGFSRPMTVVVVQPKGGAGKTPTTICLAAAFGAYRGGYVVGWDDNETR